MTSERGTRAMSPWASPDGTAYQVVSERRSADPPTGRVNDHGGGGGGASSGGPSSVGGAGLGGGGGGGGAAGSMIEIEVAVENPGSSRSGWVSSAPACSSVGDRDTSGWCWGYSGSTANNRTGVGGAPSADTTTSAVAKRSTCRTPGTVAICAPAAAMSTSRELATARISTCTGSSATTVMDCTATSTNSSMAASMATGKATPTAPSRSSRGGRRTSREKSHHISRHFPG